MKSPNFIAKSGLILSILECQWQPKTKNIPLLLLRANCTGQLMSKRTLTPYRDGEGGSYRVACVGGGTVRCAGDRDGAATATLTPLATLAFIGVWL